MKMLIRVILIAGLSFLAGQYSIMDAYNPDDLERAFLTSIRITYTRGCIEGIRAAVPHSDPLYFACMDMAEPTIKEYHSLMERDWSDGTR